MSSSNRTRPQEDLHPRLAAYPIGTPIPGRDGACLYAYSGPSMFPTLLPLDFIEVRPLSEHFNRRGEVRLGDLGRGDVILFSVPQEGAPPGGKMEQLVVHRVMAVLPGGLRTRGDHNTQDDAWLVQPAQVVGRAVAARRGARTVPIPGGWYGIARVGCEKMVRRVVRRLLDIGKEGILARRGSYDGVRGSGQGYPPYPKMPWFNPRLVVFATPRGPVTRLLVGGRVIGEYTPTERRWRIRLPYRLLIKP